MSPHTDRLGRGIALSLVAILLVSRASSAASAAHGMVAAEHELAAQAGVEMFRRGGNAVDAAVAAVFATGVLNPSSCGIGGGGFALIHDGRTGQTQVVDFRETAPAAARPDMYVRDGKTDPRLSLRGPLAVAVPGEVKGLTRILRDFGTLSLATVLEPAIRYAADGFPVGHHLAVELRTNAEEIRRDRPLAAVYLKADGSPYGEGETLAQHDLAVTLRSIAAGGEQVFYQGALAEKIVGAVSWQGSLTAADLRDYRVRLREPLIGHYRRFTVATAPPPTGGGIALEILNVLGGYDLHAAGPKSAFALHRIAQAEALAFQDRAQYYGDPAFTEVPVQRLLSTAYADELRRKIAGELAPAATATVTGKGGTAHTSVMDDQGDAVAITSTVNTAFGSMVLVPGTGIILNNEMDDFSSAPGIPNVYGLVGNEANAIHPGKRPLSSMTPMLVLEGDRPVLAIGASGGPRIISATVETLVNVLDFEMPLDSAVAAPRVHDQAVPDRLFYEPALDAAAVAGLRKLGHELVEAHDLGAVQAVQATRSGLIGASDPRKGGAAAGW